MSLILNKIGAIFIPVSNIEAARDWYCDILQVPADGEIIAGHLFVIPLNGINIVLDSKIYSEETIFKAPPFHFNTDNIEEAYEYLKNKHVEFETNIENGHWFNFRDPDGNQLMICKP